jgi:isovaleryl-CoA dehydrogenase
MDGTFPTDVQHLCAIAEDVARHQVAPRAEEVDRDCIWPEHSMRALADAGLMGLHVPQRLGGHEQGLSALAALTEALGKACSSSALCYGMHCVGTAVITAKTTPYQEERYLKPIAEGRHVTTLALSEAGTGVHFFLPQTKLQREDSVFVIEGNKAFVTNSNHADSLVVSTMASTPDAEAGEFSCLVVDRDTPGMSWLEPWRGLGMRGNCSRSVRLDQVRVPAENLLGQEGDQIWFAFEVVAPYFLMAMAGTYLGVAQAAFDISVQHLRSRRFAHSGTSLADVPALQYKIAKMWTALEKTRNLVFSAARWGDLGDTRAQVAISACKADAADTAVWLTNEAMTLCGGTAYRENSHLARLLRDARASHVMSPTTDVLKQWVGRSLLGLPML